ncbi:hypothetical protein ACTAQJ_07195 [Arthrobacter sp. alpha11c]
MTSEKRTKTTITPANIVMDHHGSTTGTYFPPEGDFIPAVAVEITVRSPGKNAVLPRGGSAVVPAFDPFLDLPVQDIRFLCRYRPA